MPYNTLRAYLLTLVDALKDDDDRHAWETIVLTQCHQVELGAVPSWQLESLLSIVEELIP